MRQLDRAVIIIGRWSGMITPLSPRYDKNDITRNNTKVVYEFQFYEMYMSKIDGIKDLYV